MQLLVSPTSPFARKARVVLRERGLLERVEEVFVNPHQDPAELLVQNRLGKIPVLVRDDGAALFDSPVICEYLDWLAGGTPLVPGPGDARWAVLRAQALADGIMDLAAASFLERSRPETEQSPRSLERWRGKIERTVGGMGETLATIRTDGLDLGHIACAVALGYLDLRLPDYDWRTDDAALAEWHAGVCARPSMQETAPPRS